MDRKTIRLIVQGGLLAGLVIVYLAALGMLETFSERELIRDYLTMGQVMIFIPVITAGIWVSNREETQGWVRVVSGALVGLVAMVFVGPAIWASETQAIRGMFVNMDRDVAEIYTLGYENLVNGAMVLTALMITFGLLGAVFTLLPKKIRSIIFNTVIVLLLVGLLSEYLNQILETIVEFFGFDDDVLDPFFRRNDLLLSGALTVVGITLTVNIISAFFGDNIQSNYQGLPKTNRTILQNVGFGAMLLVLLILPWVVGRFLSDAMTTVGLYMLMGLGLNIAIGMAGLLDLGYVTNFAVGAYLVGILTSASPQGIGSEFFNLWLALPVALLAAMGTGFMFALPVLKMRGDYLAIATLGFGEIIGRLANSDALEAFIGGAAGLKLIPKPYFFGIELNDPEQFYYIILVVLMVMIYISYRLNNSRIGRQWMAIREDEDVAAAMGIDTARAKLLAFTLSAAIGGVAGAIFASKVGAAFPNSFTLLVSLNVLSLIIVGGMNSIRGILLGALVLMGLPEILREFSEYRFLVYGVLLIWMMLQRPEGFIPSEVSKRELRRDNNQPATATGD